MKPMKGITMKKKNDSMTIIALAIVVMAPVIIASEVKKAVKARKTKRDIDETNVENLGYLRELEYLAVIENWKAQREGAS